MSVSAVFSWVSVEFDALDQSWLTGQIGCVLRMPIAVVHGTDI